MLLSVSMTARADDVLWSYSLSSLPDAWGQYGFEFSPEGAHAHHEQVWNSDFGLRGQCFIMLTEIITVPQDMDSLVLHIPQHTYLSAAASSGGFTTASVSLEKLLDGQSSEIIWARNVTNQSPPLSDSAPIHFRFTALSSGQFISFLFRGYHSGYLGETCVDMWLYGATLTAYGDMRLNCTTWGAIKDTVGRSR